MLSLSGAARAGTPATVASAGNVVRHDRAGANQRALADGDPARVSRRRCRSTRPGTPCVGHDLPVLLGLELAAGGRARKRSFMNMTPWPMNTSSSIVTPSQMKVWEEILQRAPDAGVLLDLDEGADLGLVADLAAVKVDERGLRDSHILTELDILQTHLFLAVNSVPFEGSRKSN